MLGRLIFYARITRRMKGEAMQVYDQANALAAQIRQSDEVRAFQQVKSELEENETARALIKEYKKLQMRLQLSAVAGADTGDESAGRFQQLSAVLFASPEASRYLLAEMRVQQMMADVYKLLNDASSIELPGV